MGNVPDFFAIKTVFGFDKIPLTIAKYISLKEKNNHDKKRNTFVYVISY